MAKAVDEFMTVHRGDIVDALHDLATWVKSVDWAGIGTDLKTFATGANSVAEALGGWKPVLEFLAAYKLAKLIGLTERDRRTCQGARHARRRRQSAGMDFVAARDRRRRGG